MAGTKRQNRVKELYDRMVGLKFFGQLDFPKRCVEVTFI